MSVLTLILAGAEGSRLSSISEMRAKPALPFGGRYRLIDFALSNALNSELYRVAVLTQYRPHSLMDHIGIGEPWDLNRRRPQGVHLWQPYQGRTERAWYRGTADALYQNRGFIAEDGSNRLLVVSGDHIYKLDYRDLLRVHDQKGADLTVAVMHVRPDQVQHFGILSVDADDRIVRFEEKPTRSESTLASMGIYVFNTASLFSMLEADSRDAGSSHDFGRDIIPKMVQAGRVMAYPFRGYWADVDTLQAYWEANLALLDNPPALDLYDPAWVIHTRSEERAPVKCSPPGSIDNSLASNGCVIHGQVIHSVLSPGVRVEAGAVVRDSVVMHDTVIRAGAHIDRCLLDKQVEIGPDAVLGQGDDMTPNRAEPDTLRTGLTVVGKRAVVPARAQVGRNCRIDPNVTEADFGVLSMPSGDTVRRRGPLG